MEMSQIYPAKQPYIIGKLQTTIKNKSFKMFAINTKLFCDKLSKQLKVDVAVVDVNDLGGVKILASSNNSVNNILKETLKINPAGNSDEKTPIVIIRQNQ